MLVASLVLPESFEKSSTTIEELMRTSGGISHSPRFNPFNDDKSLLSDLDDDSRVPSSGSELTSTTSEGSADVSLVELGLTEDYFAHPDGGLGMSTSEELEVAIENCKKMILELPEDSVRRKKFVMKLVQLRMKFQELKEGPTEIEPRMKQAFGHKLRKKKSNSIKYYCDCCNGLIWGVLQAWYRCKECGFNCHYKCVNMIRRKCVAIDLVNLPYTLDISPENGLSAQHFNCAECKNPISVTGMGKEEARMCDYNGLYYCPSCHWNDTSVIPGRVVHNWDFTPQKVSRQSYQILTKLYRRPLLNIQEMNPLLFNYVEELADIRKLREDILLMKVYFITCNNALDLKLLLKLSDRQHFVDCADKYSMEDLVEAHSGSLSEYLTTLHAEYAKHIKLDCLYCQAKGFICEICNSGETLFPFDFCVSTCTKCRAVFHRDCFTCIDTLCPRCERFQKKKVLRKNEENISSGSEEIEQTSSYLRSDDFSSKLRSEKSDERPPVVRYSPAFTSSTADGLDKNNDNFTRDSNNSKSSAIKIDPSKRGKKNDDSSLHSLLTESSYTDYAVLGFAGAGRGKSSVPKNNQKHEENDKTNSEISEKVLDGKIKPVVRNGAVYNQRRPKRNFIAHGSKMINYENNPVTRRPQRDENLFSDLVKSTNGRSNIDNGKTTAQQQFKPVPDTSEMGYDIERRELNGANRNQKYKTKPETTSQQYRPELDPFNNRKDPSTRFMNDVAKSMHQTNLSPAYRPELDPFHQHEDAGSKFIQDVTPRYHSLRPTSSKNYNGTKQSQNQDARFITGNNRNQQSVNVDLDGNPFESEEPTNPFYEKSGNPFDEQENYDESNNPFS